MTTVWEDFNTLIFFSLHRLHRVMVVSTRSEATKTEIIDVINGETCSNLPDFKAILGPVYQGTHFQDTPVFCGNEQLPIPINSFSYAFKCYKFKHNGGWQEFASLNGKREMAAGIVYKNKFHVFGGSGTQIREQMLVPNRYVFTLKFYSNFSL